MAVAYWECFVFSSAQLPKRRRLRERPQQALHLVHSTPYLAHVLHAGLQLLKSHPDPVQLSLHSGLKERLNGCLLPGDSVAILFHLLQLTWSLQHVLYVLERCLASLFSSCCKSIFNLFGSLSVSVLVNLRQQWKCWCDHIAVRLTISLPRTTV